MLYIAYLLEGKNYFFGTLTQFTIPFFNSWQVLTLNSPDDTSYHSYHNRPLAYFHHVSLQIQNFLSPFWSSSDLSIVLHNSSGTIAFFNRLKHFSVITAINSVSIVIRVERNSLGVHTTKSQYGKFHTYMLYLLITFNANGHLTSTTSFPQQEQDTKLSDDAPNQGSFCFNIKPDSWISEFVWELTNWSMQKESPIKSGSLNVLNMPTKQAVCYHDPMKEKPL